MPKTAVNMHKKILQIILQPEFAFNYFLTKPIGIKARAIIGAKKKNKINIRTDLHFGNCIPWKIIKTENKYRGSKILSLYLSSRSFLRCDPGRTFSSFFYTPHPRPQSKCRSSCDALPPQDQQNS